MLPGGLGLPPWSAQYMAVVASLDDPGWQGQSNREVLGRRVRCHLRVRLATRTPCPLRLQPQSSPGVLKASGSCALRIPPPPYISFALAKAVVASLDGIAINKGPLLALSLLPFIGIALFHSRAVASTMHF